MITKKKYVELVNKTRIVLRETIQGEVSDLIEEGEIDKETIALVMLDAACTLHCDVIHKYTNLEEKEVNQLQRILSVTVLRFLKSRK